MELVKPASTDGVESGFLPKRKLTTATGLNLFHIDGACLMSRSSALAAQPPSLPPPPPSLTSEMKSSSKAPTPDTRAHMRREPAPDRLPPLSTLLRTPSSNLLQRRGRRGRRGKGRGGRQALSPLRFEAIRAMQDFEEPSSPRRHRSVRDFGPIPGPRVVPGRGWPLQAHFFRRVITSR